jgi:hypothetical protein
VSQRRGVSLRYAVRTDDIERLDGGGGPAIRAAAHAGAVEAGLLAPAAAGEDLAAFAPCRFAAGGGEMERV